MISQRSKERGVDLFKNPSHFQNIGTPEKFRRILGPSRLHLELLCELQSWKVFFLDTISTFLYLKLMSFKSKTDTEPENGRYTWKDSKSNNKHLPLFYGRFPKTPKFL